MKIHFRRAVTQYLYDIADCTGRLTEAHLITSDTQLVTCQRCLAKVRKAASSGPEQLTP